MQALAVLLILLSLTACTTAQRIIGPLPPRAEYKVSVIDLNAIRPLDTISKKLSTHRVVFVGEIHTSYPDHLNQLAVVRQLHEQWGAATSIGLEMIQTPYQSILDKYISGEINEQTMLRGTQWYTRWKYDFRLYRPIFHYAKQNKIPLIALNISKELTTAITKSGIDGLTPAQRKQLPTFIDRLNPAYLERIKRVFSKHAHTRSKSFDKFLDAQLGWDEGMAFNAVKYLKTHTKKRMIILAGGGHVVHRQGIPNRLDRQLKARSAVVLNNPSEINIKTSGDYLLFSPNRKLPSIPKLGIGMKESNGKGIYVTRVKQHSSASRAGIQKRDVIVRMNQKKISDILDLKRFMEKTKAGDQVDIMVKRNNRKHALKARLKTPLLLGF